MKRVGNYPYGLRIWDENTYPQSNHKYDGELAYLNAASTGAVPTMNSCDIKTDVVGLSLKIVTPDDTNILFHVFLSEIVSCDVVNQTVYLNTSDNVQTVLVFSSNDDAITASNRIDDIMNGGDIQTCSDSNSTAFYAIIEENQPFILTETSDYMIEEAKI